MPIDKDSFDEFLGTIRRFVRERLIPNEARVAEDDAIPDDIVADMKSLGLFGLAIPEDYGGLGLSMEEEVLVIFEIARASPAFRSYFATNVGIGSQAIVMDGTEEQKRRYLPRLASGEIIGSFALTEPNSGSDAASLQTTARRDGDFYVLNGTKRFITNAPEAGVFTVMARTDPDKKGADGISAFVVDRDTAGLTVGKPDRKMGQRGAHTADVIFENCRVPRDAVIGGVEGQGFKTAMKVLDKGRLNISAACTGAAERILSDALAYALEREQFGKPIAEFQLVQAMLADCQTEILAARSMILRQPASAIAVATSPWRLRAASSSRARWSVASLIALSRSTAAPVTWPSTLSNGSTATSAFSASMKGRARSSSSSLPAI